MDVIQERLEREFNLDLITTAPSVIYHANLTDGTQKIVANPAEMPEPGVIESIEEPYVKATIMVPNDYVGAVMEIAQRKRGDFLTMDYMDDNRVNVVYEIPLSEIVYDFFDKLKSKHPGLTSNDLRLCAYLRLNFTSKEIAPLLNISVKSVEIKRYRLRKKMELPHELNLTDYIISL